mgnify:FL=1
MRENQGGLDAIKAFADIGVSRVLLPMFAHGKDPMAGISQLADEIVAKV